MVPAMWVRANIERISVSLGGQQDGTAAAASAQSGLHRDGVQNYGRACDKRSGFWL